MPSITFPSGSTLTPAVLNLSTNLASIYSTVCANSADWGNALPLDHIKWDSVYDTVSGLSGNWNGVVTTVKGNSGYWASSYTNLTANSGNWNSAYVTLCTISAGLGTSLTWVQNNSSTMYVDRLGINTNISLLPSNLKLAVNGDTVIYGNLSSLGTTTLVNVTANVTDALSVVNPGFSAPNAIYISQGGPGAGIKMNNSGSGPMMTLEGNGNVGIGTGTPNEKLTVSGNISATGVLYASGGNSNQWNANATLFAQYSAGWQNTYNTVSSTSADWNNTFNTVKNTSGDWNKTFNTVKASSGDWQNTYNTVSANSGNWNSIYNTVRTASSNWQNTYNTVSSTSGDWNNTFNTTKSNSGRWESSYTSVNSLSSTWSTASINYIIDGAGSAVTVGSKGVIYLPSGFKVNGWRVLAETPTTAKLDIRRFSSNVYKTTSLSSDSLLLDKTNPEIRYLISLNESASATGDGTTFRDISALDTLEFYVEENDFAKRFTVALAGFKTS